MESSVLNNDVVEYLELTPDSRAGQEAHERLLFDLEARKRASTVDVPTLPADVRDALRQRGEPIRLFGEDLAAIRDRLRMVVARSEILKEKKIAEGIKEEYDPDDDALWQRLPMQQTSSLAGAHEEITETTYTHASKDLINARMIMCDSSLERSRHRLDVERRRRRGMVRWTKGKKRARLFKTETIDNDLDNDDDADGLYSDIGLKEECTLVRKLDMTCETVYTSIRNQVLEGSQYGDVRPLSAVCTSSVSTAGSGHDLTTSGHHTFPKLIATGGWSGGIKIWNGGDDHCTYSNGDSSTKTELAASPLDLLGAKNIVHEDRIMSIAMKPYLTSITSFESLPIIATASIDLSAKLFMLKLNDEAKTNEAMDIEDKSKDIQLQYNVVELAKLKGHAARLCNVAFHPTGQYVVTTSFDHSWRLWEVESGRELLLQDGHAREVYGVGFHPDGSLVATTDFGGVVQCWDLRTGKSACHFIGHARRVVCSEFSPNGFQLATAGDDGTIKIWDLRRRRPSASIPAHTNVITQLKFAHSSSSQNGEFLASSSFDGTGKVWSTRDWKLLSKLQGHEGKVMGVDILDGPRCGIVTCGFDKTLKLWQ